VREVFVVESITPVPGMPAGLVGVTNLRGSVVPLLDLRQMIGLAAENAQRYAVVVKHGNWQVGVLVDTVPEIRTLSKDQFLPAPVGTGDGESLRIDRREPGRPAAWRVGDVRRSFSF
jgi:purine-binding chemotaxis protein CheW